MRLLLFGYLYHEKTFMFLKKTLFLFLNFDTVFKILGISISDNEMTLLIIINLVLKQYQPIPFYFNFLKAQILMQFKKVEGRRQFFFKYIFW